MLGRSTSWDRYPPSCSSNVSLGPSVGLNSALDCVVGHAQHEVRFNAISPRFDALFEFATFCVGLRPSSLEPLLAATVGESVQRLEVVRRRSAAGAEGTAGGVQCSARRVRNGSPPAASVRTHCCVLQPRT